MKIFGMSNFIHIREKHSSPFPCGQIHSFWVKIFQSDHPLAWGELDLPILGMTSDWHARPLSPPLGFVIAADSSALWFVATREAPASCLPGVEPGSFMEGLWQGDVAELFLADPDDGSYLELNLAPNGAWWAAKFIEPRVRSQQQANYQAIVTSYWQRIDANSWCAALRMPLDFLQKEIGFSSRTTGNVTAILNSPTQTFHSASKLPGAEPDFHQPSAFPLLKPSAL